jgi:hypothetical protein
MLKGPEKTGLMRIEPRQLIDENNLFPNRRIPDELRLKQEKRLMPAL